MTERALPENIILVGGCIDAGTNQPTEENLDSKRISEGSYHLYRTAGSPSLDVGEFIRKFADYLNSIDQFLNFAHTDCGGYIAAGDDSSRKHNQDLEALGTTLLKQKPTIRYSGHLIELEHNRPHTFAACAIILGKPEIIRASNAELRSLGLEDVHDKIARPFELSVDDGSIWSDLEISLNLHHPKKILIFDESEENARMLMEKVREIADGVPVETRVISQAA